MNRNFGRRPQAWCAAWLAAGAILGAAEFANGEEEPLASRRERVAAMSVEEKQELRQKQENFVSLPQAEQERIRTLHETLSSSPDGAQLRSVLERYHAWLATLSSGERAELLSLPAEKRLERIAALLEEQEERRFQSEVKEKLTHEDREALVKWLLAFVDEHKRQIIEALPEQRRPEDMDRWPLMFVMLRGWGEENRKMPRPDADDVQGLVDGLSPGARATLENVRDPQKRLEMARRWITAAIWSRRGPPPVSRETLRKFYAEKLSAKDRARLDALAPEEMQRALHRLYYERQFRGPGGPGRFNPSGPPRGGRGPGERRGERDRERADEPSK